MFNQLNIKTMKKITYLLTLVLTLSLMSVSCEKDDDQIVPNGIIAQDLAGTWNFVSLETFDATGTVLIKKYTLPTDLTVLTNNFNYGALKLKFNLSTLTVYDLCAVPADING
jgi:hypothetical protein